MLVSIALSFYHRNLSPPLPLPCPFFQQLGFITSIQTERDILVIYVLLIRHEFCQYCDQNVWSKMSLAADVFKDKMYCYCSIYLCCLVLIILILTGSIIQILFMNSEQTLVERIVKGRGFLPYIDSQQETQPNNRGQDDFFRQLLRKHRND